MARNGKRWENGIINFPDLAQKGTGGLAVEAARRELVMERGDDS